MANSELTQSILRRLMNSPLEETWSRQELWHARQPRAQYVACDSAREHVVTLKLNERRGNVYENKGRWYGVCGRWGKKNMGWGPRTEGQRPAPRWRAPASVAQFVTRVKTAQELKERTVFLMERFGNVYENKGPLWKTCGGSRNVYENTGT